MAEDAIQSFLASYGQSTTTTTTTNTATTDDVHIPHPRSSCCCGNAACAYLKQNASALEGLEKDVRTAARLGQVSRVFLVFL